METKPISICLRLISLLSLFLREATKLLLKIATRTTRPAPLPPGPTGWPVIGCLPQILTKNRSTSRWLHDLTHQRNTEIACIRLGKTYVIPVTSPELACDFLKKHDSTFASRPECMSGRLSSANYLTAVLAPAGPQWKKMRKIVSTEILSTSMHKFLHKKRCEEADHLVRHVMNRSGPGGGLVDVRAVAQHYCGNVVRKLVFGERFFGPGAEDGGPGEEEIVHHDGIFSVLNHLYGFAIADYVPWVEAFDFDGYKRAIKNGVRCMDKFHDPEIVKRVEMWRRGVRTEEDDILDVLINLRDPESNKPLLSVEEIKAQIREIFLAALDNPSNAAEWAIAEMINQPSMLDRACQELDRVVGRERLVEESDLPNLNYIKSCVKESFRLHPVNAFNLPHVSTSDAVVGGYFIPKGSQVLVSRLGLGRNPRVWKDPLVYKPERHMIDDEVVLVDHKLRLFSFGTGRRGCAGVVLGTTMSAMLLARLIQGFSWEAPVDGVELVESENNMLMAKPLVAVAKPVAKPRLDLKVYQ